MVDYNKINYSKVLPFFEKKRILITGGAGFIGSNIAEILLNSNVSLVRVLDNFSTGKRENIEKFLNYPNFELIEGDIRDYKTCLESMKDIDFVSHQAALGSVPRSINDPITTNEVNIGGFLNIMMAVKESKVKKIVYAASSSTYGDSKELPKIENRIGNPLSPYAVTKYVNELYAQVFSNLYDINSIGLRYFNVFGPKQNPNGEYAAVIPLFIKSILEKTSPIINGDGSQTRDFTFVQNAVEANLKSLIASTKGHSIINIAYGERTSLNQIWELLSSFENVQIKPHYRESRVGDIKDSLADISKARELIGYSPLFSVREGLKVTLDWYKSNYGKNII